MDRSEKFMRKDFICGPCSFFYFGLDFASSKFNVLITIFVSLLFLERKENCLLWSTNNSHGCIFNETIEKGLKINLT